MHIHTLFLSQKKQCLKIVFINHSFILTVYRSLVLLRSWRLKYVNVPIVDFVEKTRQSGQLLLSRMEEDT